MSVMYSTEINLAEVFQNVRYLAILRMGEDFPNYYAYSDIDILCSEDGEIVEDLYGLFELKFIAKEKYHAQLDYILKGKLDLKFDLYSRVISKKFTQDLIRDRIAVERDGVSYYVPSEEHDGVLKCQEYLNFPVKKERYKEFLKYKSLLDEYIKS